ncbi:MAG TPA: DoxX family protein [Chitinophagales bacterium]|nr:DoxX family protein [Chitinophagales bacterium]
MNEATLKDIGYLILRLGLGALMARHGWPKIIGGPEKWESLGSSLSVIGITFLPVFWGFCAAVAEFAGGICVAIGILFRPACALVVITMLIAFIGNFGGDSSFGDWSEPAELGVAFLAMLIMGPGKYSLSVSLKK